MKPVKLGGDSPKPEYVYVDKFVPNWGRRCEVCGSRGTVAGLQGTRTVYKGDMCGACTWGEAAMADPDNWNK